MSYPSAAYSTIEWSMDCRINNIFQNRFDLWFPLIAIGLDLSLKVIYIILLNASDSWIGGLTRSHPLRTRDQEICQRDQLRRVVWWPLRPLEASCFRVWVIWVPNIWENPYRNSRESSVGKYQTLLWYHRGLIGLWGVQEIQGLIRACSERKMQLDCHCN